MFSAGSSLLNFLVLYHPLSDVNDSSGNGHTLTNNGVVTFTGGKVGNAANFVAASSQYLDRADEAATSMGDIDFSIAMWVNFTTLSRQLFLGKGDANGASDEYYLELTNTSRLLFHVGNNVTFGEVTATTFGALSAATWYFVVAWHDSVGNTVNLSINNGAAESAAYTGGSYNSSFAFALGRDGTFNGLYLNGLLDEVGIWKRLLTAAERTALYNNGLGQTWPLP